MEGPPEAVVEAHRAPEAVAASHRRAAEAEDRRVQLPRAPWPQGTARVLLDTSVESPELLPEEPLVERSLTVAAGSVAVLGITPD